MRSHFIDQVEILMEFQQMKNAESIKTGENEPKYYWLYKKKLSLVCHLPIRDEYKIRQALEKIPEDQQAQVIKQLLLWQDLHPRASPFKIPEITITIINNLAVNNIIVQQNFSRMGSFRNSLRKLISNKISPETSDSKPRYVTFNDVPVVYKISKMPKHC